MRSLSELSLVVEKSLNYLVLQHGMHRVLLRLKW